MSMSRFAIYYDFETMQIPCPEDNNRRRHVPIAVAAIRICNPNRTYNSSLHHRVGLDCVERFLDWLDTQRQEIQIINATENQPLKMTREDWFRFHRQTSCEMCGQAFTELNSPYKDHCHISGKFRFALCNRCNLIYGSEKTTASVPCFAHGGVRFDQHLLIKAIARRNKKRGKPPPRILPRNTEHYLAVFDGELVFQDSFEFMKASLASIADSMKNDKSTISSENDRNSIAFPLLWEYVQRNEERYQLMTRKGVFCYDFLDEIEKLKLDALPPSDQFYDSLHQIDITMADYEHAKHVWRAMSCETLKDYLLVYLITDVLLLASCFEQFRNLSMQYFQMDTGKFLTLPHFAYHAMLKCTQVQLEILTDLEMVHWIKRGIRGGVASVMLRHAEANLPEMGPNYNPELPRQEIVPLDCTNLYGHALSKQLPEKSYRWLTRQEIKQLKISEVPDDAKIGYILSVDLSYPPELHESHTMYPLAPHKTAIPPAQWSDYTYELGLKLNDPSFFKTGPENLYRI
ncbi:uncharacterized protein LOC135495094 [Lineus longissimus]|uniref:uncharacterized protein LOC135495094 n=1 Tax=Lineus longissimus TaxID=88925 RepID=UPI00315D758F